MSEKDCTQGIANTTMMGKPCPIPQTVNGSIMGGKSVYLWLKLGP